jgi:exodeoxyribonuclease-3
MQLKVTSWNINSVRLRIGLVERFLIEQKPDVLCLQEIKCRDAEFPLKDFRKLGYEHIAINGQKGYHGVAIVSRLPIEEINKREFCEKGDARHISVNLAPIKGKPITIHNFYIPAGGDEPDPAINEKFAHKLQFLDELQEWTKASKLAKDNSILVGDLNIAPLEHDVWSHKALLSVVSHTPIETEKLTKIYQAGPWIDAIRHFIPADQKAYSWWSYRSPNWLESDRGRRLDHIWLSKALASKLTSIDIFKEARGWERPSDHAPISAVLDLSKSDKTKT